MEPEGMVSFCNNYAMLVREVWDLSRELEGERDKFHTA